MKYFYPKEGIRNYALKPPPWLFSAIQKDVVERDILFIIYHLLLQKLSKIKFI